jgi:hypothetical protein
LKILKKLYIPFIAGLIAVTGFLMPAINIEYSTDTGLHVGQAITVNAGSSNVKACCIKRHSVPMLNLKNRAVK